MEKGQLLYIVNKNDDGKCYYDIGIVTDVYDGRIFALLKYKNHITSINSDNIRDHLGEEEEGTMLLKVNGEPAFAKKNIFGKFTF